MILRRSGPKSDFASLKSCLILICHCDLLIIAMLI